jgi:release factor glutamine methyltransferase
VNPGDAEGRELPGARKPGGPSRREALEGIARELAAAGIEPSRVEAERLLSLAVGISRADLQLSLASELSAEDARTLARSVRRRLAGEPLQHIEGQVEFRSLVLAADGRAFVPRPETEQLLDRILEWARGRQQTEAGVRVVARPSGRAYVDAALDIGTGSGAIALALADEHVAARIVALDRSRRALEQATENRRAVGQAESNVQFRLVEGTLWEAVCEGERFDLIVSNPPYVSRAEMDRLPREVRRDPSEALVAGEDGLDVIREILADAWDHLQPGGALFLEIGEGQGERVRELLEESGDWARTAIWKDLAGKARFAMAERP